MRPKLPTHQVWENVLSTLLKNIVYNRRHKHVSDPPLSHFSGEPQGEGQNDSKRGPKHISCLRK